MLEILTKDFGEAVVFRIRPQVRIEPVQLVRRTSAHGLAQDRFIGVENGELFQKLFSFP